MPAGRRRPRREICVTVEEDGVWIYANRDGLKALADRIGVLVASDPAEHYELHLRWHLGSHGRGRNPVFVVMDEKARKVHSRERFEVTVMAVEPKDLRKLRGYEKPGKLPRVEGGSGGMSPVAAAAWLILPLLLQTSPAPCSPSPRPVGPPSLVVEVVDRGGLPVPGVDVTVVARGGKGEKQMARTDKSGLAEFWLAAGVEYTVEAWSPGFRRRRVKAVRVPKDPGSTGIRVQLRLQLAGPFVTVE